MARRAIARDDCSALQSRPQRDHSTGVRPPRAHEAQGRAREHAVGGPVAGRQRARGRADELARALEIVRHAPRRHAPATAGARTRGRRPRARRTRSPRRARRRRTTCSPTRKNVAFTPAFSSSSSVAGVPAGCGPSSNVSATPSACGRRHARPRRGATPGNSGAGAGHGPERRTGDRHHRPRQPSAVARGRRVRNTREAMPASIRTPC